MNGQDGTQYHSVAWDVLRAVDAKGVVLVVRSPTNGHAASVAILDGDPRESAELVRMLRHVADRMEADVARGAREIRRAERQKRGGMQ